MAYVACCTAVLPELKCKHRLGVVTECVVVQAMVAGGPGLYCANAMTPAGSKSWLFDLSPGADHSLIEEDLAFSRTVSRL